MDESAESHELVGSEIVGLHCIPGIVEVRRTFVAIADGVIPDEPRGIVSAVAPETHIDLLQQRDGIGTKTFDVVGWHERNRTDMKVAGSGACDLKSGIRGIFRSGEVEWE